MTLMKFDKRIVEKQPQIFEYIQKKHKFLELIFYVIDWRYRKAVNLRTWLLNQVDNPSQAVKDYCDKIPNSKDPDTQMLNILKKVSKDLKYVSDKKVWDVDEKWQTAEETINLMTGDCEDGSVLIYVLARLKGISHNRLLLSCGSVQGGGHCWLAYKPTEYPLNFAYLDWCYWVSTLPMNDRKKFFVNQQKIIEYYNNGKEKPSLYYDIWFMFNEKISFKKYDITKVN